MKPSQLPLFALLVLTVAACGGTAEQAPLQQPPEADAASTKADAAIAADTSTGVDGSTPSSLKGLSFDLQAHPSGSEDPCAGYGGCSPAVLFVEELSDSSLSVVLGGSGFADRATLTRDSDTWILTTPLRLETWPDTETTLGYSTTTLASGTFDFRDHDNDGKVDVLVSAKYDKYVWSGDYSTKSAGKVELSGTLDSRLPAFGGVTAPLFPLDLLEVLLSEPLRANAEASLSDLQTGEVFPLVQQTESDVVVGFKSQQIPRLGHQYSLGSTGLDLSGLGSPTALTVSTNADPGVLALDGFEGSAMTGIGTIAEPKAVLINDYYGVPVPNGKQALFVPKGGVAFLHLTRQPSQSRVTLKTRKVHPTCGDGNLVFTAGVIGGSLRSGATVGALGDDVIEVDTGGGALASVGGVQQLTFPLDDPGPDVIVKIEASYFSYGFTCYSSAGIIDDVQLE